MTLIQKLTDHLIENEYIPKDDREIYEYGFDIIFYTIWSTLALLLIGLVLKQFWSAAIIILGFYTFQSFGGGYHANSHLKCFLTMTCGLMVGLSFVFLQDYPAVLHIITGISTLVLLMIPLTIHPNKSFLEPKRKPLSIRSVIVTLSTLILTILVSIFFDRFLCAFSAAFFLAAISRIVGKLKYNKLSPSKGIHDPE
jgi:accessory gene regulator B